MSVSPPNKSRTRHGFIQFLLAKQAKQAVQRLSSRKKKKKLVIDDMWHAPIGLPAEDANPSLAPEDATPSLAAEEATPPPAAEEATPPLAAEEATPPPAAEPSSTPTSQLPDERPEEPKSRQDPHVNQLFIGSLPSGLSEKELREKLKKLFEPFGQIKWLRIGVVSSPSHVYFSLTRCLGYGPDHDAKGNAIPFCHLEFVQAETALDAFRFSRRERIKFKRHEITIALKKAPRPSNTLYFRAYFGSKLALWDTVRDFVESTR